MSKKALRRLPAERECEDLLEICLEIYSNTGGLEGVDIPLGTPEGYHRTLERIIVLFEVYLKFTLEFLGLSPNVCKAFNKQRSISKPLDMSVSALSYTLWTRIKFLISEDLKREAKFLHKESEHGIANQECQTELLALSDCESCEVSKDIIRELINKVDVLCSKNNIKSFVGILRQQLRPRMHEITAWAAMTFWYEAIMFDIEALSKIEKKENNTKPKVKLNQLKETINKLETELGYGHFTAQGAEIRKLKKRVLKLKMKLVKKSEETKDLTEKLHHSEKTSKQLKDEIEELKKKSNCEQKSIAELENKITDKIEDVNYIMAKYEKEIDSYKRKIELLELENGSKQLLINEQFTSINVLEGKLQERIDNEIKLKEQIGLLQEELVIFNGFKDEHQKLRIKYNERTKHERKLSLKIRELENKLIVAKESDSQLPERIENNSSFPVKLTGDIQIDTAMQKMANEQKIKLLQIKNEKLQSTLDKIFKERNKIGNSNPLKGERNEEIKKSTDYISYFLSSLIYLGGENS